MIALLLLEKLPWLIFNNLLSAHQQHTIPIIALVIPQYLHTFIRLGFLVVCKSGQKIYKKKRATFRVLEKYMMPW
jgi:hypothetical protein